MIIGIVGFLGSGKGTVGDILYTEHSYFRFSFASPLKDAVSHIFGWPRSLLEGDTEKSRVFRETVDQFWSEKLKLPNFTPRMALQLMGTEAGRNVFGPDLWTASLEYRIKDVRKAVITDVRFRNEIACITRMGGKIWRVKRFEDPSWYHDVLHFRMNSPNDARLEKHMERLGIHSSEWDWIGALPNNTVIINNDGSLNDLKAKIAEALNETV